MDKKFVLTIVLVTVLLVGISSAYICIDTKEDSREVQEFKIKLNNLALQQDINNGLSEQQIITKLKYFSPCR